MRSRIDADSSTPTGPAPTTANESSSLRFAASGSAPASSKTERMRWRSARPSVSHFTTSACSLTPGTPKSFVTEPGTRTTWSYGALESSSCRRKVARLQVREAGIGEVRGVVRSQGRGVVERAERRRGLLGHEERHAELVQRIGLIGNELEHAAERRLSRARFT